MVRVGVVGYGTMGRVHSQALQAIPGAELVMVADPDSERRAQAERDFGVDTVSSIEEMLKTDGVDLVDICTPTYLHEAMFAAAVQAQKHIFLEKPLARTLEEGQRMLELGAGYPKKVGVGHVVRFTPAYAKIRERVLAGEIGSAAVARTFRGGSQFPQGWHDWYADYDLSGGVILDLTIHDLDYLCWLFGEVERVYAKTTHGRTSAHLEWAFIVLRFKSGLIAHVEGAWANFPGEFYTTLEIAGSGGLLSYDSRQHPIIAHAAETKQAAAVSVPESIGGQNPYFLELQDMIGAILEERDPLVTLEDAFGTLKVALAAVESAQTGRVVEI